MPIRTTCRCGCTWPSCCRRRRSPSAAHAPRRWRCSPPTRPRWPCCSGSAALTNPAPPPGPAGSGSPAAARLRLVARRGPARRRDAAARPARTRARAGLRAVPPVEDVERPRVRLADVGGMDEVKERLELAFLGAAAQPGAARVYGKSPARRPAALRPARLRQDVPRPRRRRRAGRELLRVSLNDVLDMWLGERERNLHELSQPARRTAPCVLFLDELDALGQKRSHLRTPARCATSSTSCWPSSTASSGDNEGVFVLAATNHPWDVDTALRRPGRLDRTCSCSRRTSRRARRSCATTCATARRPGSTSTARPAHRGLLRRRPRPRVRDRRRAGARGLDARGPAGAGDHPADLEAAAREIQPAPGRGSRPPATSSPSPTPTAATTTWPRTCASTALRVRAAGWGRRPAPRRSSASAT